jgi:predicted DCC family thiol-disulfide oxidoreductase YuxK
MPTADGPIVLFDGVCKFCNASVNFILDRDRAGRVRFATLQSAAGQAYLQRFGLPTDRFGSLVLVEGGRCWQRSTAALRIARHLDGLWPAAAFLLAVPPFLRDAAYDLLARNRYRWFGQLDNCRVPTPEVRQRFLD